MSITSIDIGGLTAEYHTEFLTFFDSKKVFDALLQLDWRHEGDGKVPRKEYYTSDDGSEYTYGKGFERTYKPQPKTMVLNTLQKQVEQVFLTKFNFCFLNYYRDGHDHLGWHADDAEEIDHTKPIIVLTFGASRELWVQPKTFGSDALAQHPELATPDVLNPDIWKSALKSYQKERVKKILLENDSAFVMPPGMQLSHLHRIPKSADANCSARISLTYRAKK